MSNAIISSFVGMGIAIWVFIVFVVPAIDKKRKTLALPVIIVSCVVMLCFLAMSSFVAYSFLVRSGIIDMAGLISFAIWLTWLLIGYFMVFLCAGFMDHLIRRLIKHNKMYRYTNNKIPWEIILNMIISILGFVIGVVIIIESF